MRLVRGLLLLGVLALAGTVLWAALHARVHDVRPLARHVPHRTALMRQRAEEARREGRTAHVDVRWVPYERISPWLRRAVLIAEDDAFYQHGGLDWNELQSATRRNLEERRVVRGGSTITQQLARNLFLGIQRTPTRKLEEIFLAFRLERALSKRRIFELYLNLIEWGDGVYGAEAAARHWFGVPASRLNARQSLALAAVIVNPRRFSPVAPSRRTERRIRMIASRMRRRGYLDEQAYALAIGRPRPAPVGDTLPVPAAESALAAPPPLDSTASPDTTPVSPPATP